MRKNVDIDDTKLQELFDSNLSNNEKENIIPNGSDAVHYANMFEALKQEPSIEIPDTFSSKVAALAHKRNVKKEILTTYATYALVFLCFAIFSLLALFFVDKESLTIILKAIVTYKSPLALGGIFIIIIQVLDYKLLGFPSNKVSSLN